MTGLRTRGVDACFGPIAAVATAFELFASATCYAGLSGRNRPQTDLYASVYKTT